MKNHRTIQFFLILCLLSLGFLACPPSSYASVATNQIIKDIKARKAINPDQKVRLLLPINIYLEKINLSVIIPGRYTVLDNPPTSDLMEFIPSTDKNPYAWSEIITVIPYIGKKLNATQIMDRVVSGMQKNASDFKVIDKDSNQNNKYTEAFHTVTYKNKNRLEVVVLFAVSGPFDAAMVQYAMHLDSPDKLQEAIQTLKAFFRENVTLINADTGRML